MSWPRWNSDDGLDLIWQEVPVILKLESKGGTTNGGVSRGGASIGIGGTTSVVVTGGGSSTGGASPGEGTAGNHTASLP